MAGWLAVDPDDWPPDHYQTLGLTPETATDEAVDRAAESRLEHVRRYQMAHPNEAEEAANMIARARQALATGQDRSRHGESMADMPPPPSVGTPPPVPDAPVAAATPSPVPPTSPAQQPQPQQPTTFNWPNAPTPPVQSSTPPVMPDMNQQQGWQSWPGATSQNQPPQGFPQAQGIPTAPGEPPWAMPASQNAQWFPTGDMSQVANFMGQMDKAGQHIGGNTGQMLGLGASTAQHAATGDIAGLIADSIQSIQMQGERADRLTATLRETGVNVISEAAKGITGSGRAGEAVGGLFGAGQSAVEGVQKALPDMIPIFGDMMAASLEPMKMMFAFPKMIAESVDKLRDWNDQLYKSNMRFAEFSSSMAQVQAEQEARTIYYEQNRGEARADTARTQAEARQRLDNALAPIEDALSNTANSVSAFLSDFAAGGARDLNKALGLENDDDDEDRQKTWEIFKAVVTAMARLFLKGDNSVTPDGAATGNWYERWGASSAAATVNRNINKAKSRVG